MSEFDDLLKMLVDFREDRDWAQFHDSKNLALALSIEAAELNELFLWKTESQAEDVNVDRLKEELADVFVFAILLAGKHRLDIPTIIKRKIAENAVKYPIEKVKGTATKYKDL